MVLRYAMSRRRVGLSVHCQAKQYELRICIHRTCKRQGSEQLLKFAVDLGLPSLKAAPIGCLGNCGNGPNMVVLPDERLLHHVATPNDLAQVLRAFCRTSIDDTILQATQLRLAGNAHAAQQDFRQAINCYSQALQLGPSVGTHMLYSNRSAVYLQEGDKDAALADAQRAVEYAPPGFHNAAIRLIDTLFALGRFDEAAELCKRTADQDSSFKFREEYTAIKKALQSVGQQV
ncbi:hypothetical protein Vafri_10796 [Volvox africanus]|uniref:Uncharacterized protein n=1 Tax=Volvox africanus TaxID=51714 RepID=A0A8J4F3Q4_9CHLO|nr:hypothetical protein Vafri_10796 [Volvox africanus]